MEKKIYVQLINEVTKVYRPVPAFEIETNVYKLGGHQIYDSDDELWEFTPGTVVIVEERNLEGETVLVATTEKN